MKQEIQNGHAAMKSFGEILPRMSPNQIVQKDDHSQYDMGLTVRLKQKINDAFKVILHRF